MPRSGLEKVADMAVHTPYWNPRKVEKAPVLALLENAYYGRVPVTT
jgi:hypothetical protein